MRLNPSMDRQWQFIRDRAIPLVWLHDYFGVPRDEERKNMLIVLVGIAEKRFGLVVDELIGNQEVVVTNLGSYIGKVEGISGATIWETEVWPVYWTW